MSEAVLNGDLTQRVSVATASLDWSPSPSPTVWRKRVHRVGPPESGQVTSIVRYDAGSAFPVHEHPEGEEILVLEGVFTDDRGDWPAGTYLLNPEGYRHAPSSREGCVLFVKLRQYPGLDRRQVALDTNTMPWQASDVAGIETKRLYSQAGYRDRMQLERWAPGTGPVERPWPDGAELLVLAGSCDDADGHYDAGTWIRLPCGSAQTLQTAAGCTLYVKRGGQYYLR